MSNIYGSSYQTSPPYATAGSYTSGIPPSPMRGGGGGVGGGGGYIEPGSMTYTPARQDGQNLYCIYRAEPSSYQTPQGVVHGIQWQLVDITPISPVNLLPADRDFFASWGPNGEKERQRMVENWLRDAKIAKREEREAARYAAADWVSDRDGRQRDLEGRGRRISSNPNYGTDYSQFPPAVPTTRARSRSYSRYEQADEELARAMGGVTLDRDRDPYDTQRRERERRRSVSRGPALSRSRGPSPSRLPDYTATNTARPRKASVSYPTAAEYSSMNYGAYASPPSPNMPRGSSPYMGQGGVLPGGPVYPPTHILAGRPIPGLQPGDTMGQGGATVTSYHRSSSPRPATLPNYRSPSPRPGVESMYRSPSPRPDGIYRSSSPRPDAVMYRSSSPRPDAVVSVYRSSSRAPSPQPLRETNVPPSFSRPPSMAFPYTYFTPMMIAPDLNRMFKEFPQLPAVLVPHDVHPEDWNRCIKDIITSWFNRRAENEIITRKPATVVARLIDIWNATFFAPRGVELVLFRGRQRCSGPQAGRYDAYLPMDEASDDSDLSTLSSDGEDGEDPYAQDMFGYGSSRYGPAGSHWITDSRKAQRARKEAIRLKMIKQQQQQQQQRIRRELKERRRKQGLPYTLYLECLGNGQPLRMSSSTTAAYAAAISGREY